MSYQPEERYWTDYLRIALPVVGLLLMLGLFWYWASAVIGDDNNEPKATATANVALITDPTPSPTVAGEITIPVTAVTPSPTAQPNDAGNGDDTTKTAAPDDEATEPADEALGKGFKPDDVVETNTDAVRLRSEPSTEADVIDTLDTGVELTVTAAGVEDGDYIWIGVVDENGQEGYVADEFVDLVE